MLVLALAIVPLLVLPLVVDLSPTAETMFFVCDWIIWGAFALEYGMRLYLAPAKRQFIRSNIIDLVLVLVPFLRPLRLVRSARFLRLLRTARVGVFLLRGIKAVQRVLSQHKLHYTLLVAGAVTVGAGVIVAELERGAVDANITTVPQGLWWAITTVTTVGYGDAYPVTAAGRAFAVVLMLVGVGLFGLLAASLASFLIQRGHDEEVEPDDIGLEDIAARLERIEEQLARLSDDRRKADLSEDSPTPGTRFI